MPFDLDVAVSGSVRSRVPRSCPSRCRLGHRGGRNELRGVFGARHLGAGLRVSCRQGRRNLHLGNANLLRTPKLTRDEDQYPDQTENETGWHASTILPLQERECGSFPKGWFFGVRLNADAKVRAICPRAPDNRNKPLCPTIGESVTSESVPVGLVFSHNIHVWSLQSAQSRRRAAWAGDQVCHGGDCFDWPSQIAGAPAANVLP